MALMSNKSGHFDAQKAAEAIKKKKIEALQDNIDILNNKSKDVNSQISQLTLRQIDLNQYLGEWNAQKALYINDNSLSEVVIVNLFEGVCADKIHSNLSSCILEMDATCSKVAGLNENVGIQISKLEQQLFQIDAQLKSLRDELNSI